VRAARGGVAAHDFLGLGLHEDDLGGTSRLLELFEGGLPSGVEVSLAHVHAEGKAPVAAGVLALEEAHQLGHEAGGKAVDAEISQILKDVERRGFPGPGEAGDHHDRQLFARMRHGEGSFVSPR
jgi:hypothetical protein